MSALHCLIASLCLAHALSFVKGFQDESVEPYVYVVTPELVEAPSDEMEHRTGFAVMSQSYRRANPEISYHMRPSMGRG